MSPKITAVDVYLQSRKSRSIVGRLEKIADNYVFTYSQKYLYGKKMLPLGPDLPLTKRQHVAKDLFPAFLDRLPSKDNPAYPEYLKKFDLDASENDLFTLLATVGRSGPSSFIFEGVKGSNDFQVNLRGFRSKLNLSLRDFASLFDVSYASVQKIETGKSAGRDVMKRLEIYQAFPDVALYEVKKNGYRVHSAVKEKIINVLEESKNAKRN